MKVKRPFYCLSIVSILMCSSCGTEDVTIEDICRKWEGCRQWDYGPPELWEVCPYRYMQISKNCLKELDAALCSNLSVQEAEKIYDICWPECFPSITYCRGDQRVKCDGHEWVTNCNLVCESAGSSGTCGEETDGTINCICD
jgi:hypothetical protein